MSWLNNGTGPDSDLLSVALGESGLDLEAHEPLQDLGKSETSGYNSGFAGATLSLESTSTPNDLLNWAFLLSNTNSQNLPPTQDDLSSFLEPFNEFEPASDHPSLNNKTSNTSKDYQTQSNLYLGDGDFHNIIPQTTNKNNPSFQATLKDLLSTEDFPNSSTKKPTNGLTVNKEPPTRNDVVSKLWATEQLKISDVTEGHLQNKDEEDGADEEDEDLGYSDTYAHYSPSKLRIGKNHPDPVVETSSLSSVAPPDVWYRLAIPKEVIDDHLLSALQLEAIVYASQRHETLLGDGTRAGFLIGDGAGVGKGRTVAGIISENYLLGRKRALWLSVSNDLQYDAIRDLRDIKCNVNLRSLNKFKYEAKLSSKKNGSFKKGVLFATYSSLIGESQGTSNYRTRLSQIVKWCGPDFDGVIILDECHKAKNLVPTGASKPTKTGKTVLELQEKLPKARVVYCSATGASEPRNMAYMSRLGIWGKGTPFKEFGDFIQAVERRGVGAMELVAMDMKLRGMYMARQLSFAGVTFDIKEVPLSEKFIEMYNASAILWQQAREMFETAIHLVDNDTRIGKKLWAQFWAAHQRFFKYLCIASKVEAAVAIAKDATKNQKCVVIGLQSTGEARTLEQLGENGSLNEFVSTAKGVFQALIEKHFPVPNSTGGFDFGNNSPKTSTQIGKKRKSGTVGKARSEKKFKKEDLYGHCGLSGDELNSDGDDDENDKMSLSNDSDLPDRTQIMNSDEDDEIVEDSYSDSDDEDNWLKQIKEKPKKKAKQKSRNGSPLVQDETSMDALLAAGLHVNTLAWNKPASVISTAVKATPIAESSGSSNSFDGILAKLEQKPNGKTTESLVNYIKTTTITSDQFPTFTPAEQCRIMKTELLHKLDYLANYLPNNTLDQLMDDLGGPDNVAEMTGRKGRVVKGDDGSVQYELRSAGDVPLELLNIAEKKRFMDGDKVVAVISEAASSGISLQADRRAKNQKRRVHITLELPWSADKAIQQFGRTHRSNQVSAPEYLFLISKLSGEQRFASIVAKRLESLGALTHGDRRATESRDLSKYNFDNKYGRTALELVLKSILGQLTALAKPPTDYIGDFFTDVRKALIGVGVIVAGQFGNDVLDKDYANISKFLNRLLGLEVSLQNALFQYFTSTLDAVIQQAKRNGRYDEGILDLGSQGEDVQRLNTKTFNNVDASGSTELHTVTVERGLSWERAVVMLQDHELPNEGFYMSRQVRNNKRTAILVKTVASVHKETMFHIYRPNTGLQQKQETIQEVKKSYEKVAVWSAQPAWIDQYDSSETQCGHSYWKGNCKKKALGLICSVGLRKRTYHILSGSVLRVWSQVENVLATQGGSNSRMQIIRVRTVDGMRIVGSLIPHNCVEALTRELTPRQPIPGDPGFPLVI